MRYTLLINIDKTAPRRTRPRWRRFSGATSVSRPNCGPPATRWSTPSALRPDGEASRVRLKAGQPLVIDGPFAETKEVLGGFYVIECDTKDEAIGWAKKIPLREDRAVEVRPVWPK